MSSYFIQIKSDYHQCARITWRESRNRIRITPEKVPKWSSLLGSHAEWPREGSSPSFRFRYLYPRNRRMTNTCKWVCDSRAFTEAHPSAVQTHVLPSIFISDTECPPPRALSHSTLIGAQCGGTTTISIIWGMESWNSFPKVIQFVSKAGIQTSIVCVQCLPPQITIQLSNVQQNLFSAQQI